VESRPEVNPRWTDTDAVRDEGGLKHQAASETRRVPIPPEVIAILRVHIGTFDVTPDGRIFSSERGHPITSTAISDVWAEPKPGLRSLPGRLAPDGSPHDLRHASVSLWLNAGVPATDVAERAGRIVEVLLRSTPTASMTARRWPTPG
jgi:integrase